MRVLQKMCGKQETLAEIEEKIHSIEHQLYPKVIKEIL
jgi:folate-dependent phosphoribosylglycinamide formyltransferase PurN